MKLHPDIEAIGHVSPRSRIDLNPPTQRSFDVVPAVDVRERDRIWRAVEETAKK
jgi:hypothetical protein